MKPTVPPEPAPPTVAPARPAREVAHDAMMFDCPALGHFHECDRATAAIERDRASRSPGLKCEVCGSALARVEEQGVPVLPARYFCTGYRCLPSSPSVGQEGPSPAREEEK